MRKFILPLLIVFIGTLLGWQLLRPGYVPMHDDLQVMRLYQMRKCLNDGQIPCRWSPDMGWGYGQPMFNFYSAFPYYLGGLINLLGFSYVDTSKILFLVSLLVSGLFTYLLLKAFVKPLPALVGAVAYMAAPYHALDIFVRGALAESWALALIPVVLYFIGQLITSPTIPRLIILSVVSAFFATTHNISLMLTLPIILAFTFVTWFYRGRGIKTVLYLSASALLAFGLSAFFLLPIVFEQNLINTSALTSDYFQYQAHYASLRQLFASHLWGYGPSKFGVDDNISFFVGDIQILALITSVIPMVMFLRKRQFRQFFLLILFWFIAMTAIFMTHGKSVYIWDRLSFMRFVQFPWRFLGLSILGTSVVIALIVDSLPKRVSHFAAIVTVIFLIVLNFRYFTFEHYWPWVTDEVKLSGELYNLQAKAAIADYLPVTGVIPTIAAPALPVVDEGNVNIHYFDKRSNYFSFDVDIFSDSGVIKVPVMYFPNWTVYHNAESVKYPIQVDLETGNIVISADKGAHRFQGWFENTPIRNLANTISLSTFGFILLLLGLKKNHQSNSQS